MRKCTFSLITVRRKPGDPCRGWLVAGPAVIPVSLGRGGIKANKREGDGATPSGRFHPQRIWWRADKHPRPSSRLPLHRIAPNDGWCENPRERHYNRPIKVPKTSNADRLTRDDGLYDFIVEIDHNARPRIAGRGSAVFIHVARDGFKPTAGCIALTMPALKRLLARLDRRTRIIVSADFARKTSK
jgi:L,D-peptidoglycan transpeptidase YkuD (ErfK/YbiS/YcfS/YnhG family)